VEALVTLLVLWYEVTAQQATLGEGLEAAGKVLVVALFVTILVVATTFAVGDDRVSGSVSHTPERMP
jgi:hypothetical protein